MKYKVMVMAFDGEYKIERPEFNTIEEAREHAANLGSKWFFFPFDFIITETEKTIVDSSPLLSFLKGKRVSTAQKLFKKSSEREDMQGKDVEEFALTLAAENGGFSHG